jgi:hypothetical protein
LFGRLSGIRTKDGQSKINDKLTALKLSPDWEECGPCPVFASYTLAIALKLRKKHGETSVRVAEVCQLARWKQNIQNRAYITIRILYTECPKKIVPFFYFFFLGAQFMESGVSCTDCCY